MDERRIYAKPGGPPQEYLDQAWDELTTSERDMYERMMYIPEIREHYAEDSRETVENRCAFFFNAHMEQRVRNAAWSKWYYAGLQAKQDKLDAGVRGLLAMADYVNQAGRQGRKTVRIADLTDAFNRGKAEANDTV